jgi:hypothetical protein
MGNIVAKIDISNMGDDIEELVNLFSFENVENIYYCHEKFPNNREGIKRKLIFLEYCKNRFLLDTDSYIEAMECKCEIYFYCVCLNYLDYKNIQIMDLDRYLLIYKKEQSYHDVQQQRKERFYKKEFLEKLMFTQRYFNLFKVNTHYDYEPLENPYIFSDGVLRVEADLLLEHIESNDRQFVDDNLYFFSREDKYNEPEIQFNILKENWTSTLWKLGLKARRYADREKIAYKEGYKWAANNYLFKGKECTAKRIEKAYHSYLKRLRRTGI